MKAHSAATPIALVILAAAAAAYAYFVDYRTVSDADRAARPKDVFPSLRADEVNRVELEHGRERFVLERAPDAGAATSTPWVITSQQREMAAKADSAAVDMLLRELEFATRVRQVPDGASLASVALATPRLRGKVKVGALQYRFALGADAPRPEGAAYMNIEGEGTFVVERSLKAQLLRGADAYRDRTVVTLGESDITRVEVRAPGGHGFALERSGHAARIGEMRMRASRPAADHVFATLADLRVDSFLDSATAAQATTALRVRIAGRDGGQVHELVIGGRCPGQPDDIIVLRASPSPLAGCAASTLLDALNVTQESLVDASALWARADEVEQVRLETVSGIASRVEIARKAGGWHERAPQDRDLDADESDSASGLAVALANARATETPKTPTGEKLTVRALATVVSDRGTSTEVIELAAPAADGTVLARRMEDGAILRLSRDVARHFEPHPVALRSRTFWRAPFDAAAVVAVDDGCTSVPTRVELEGGTWVMRTPHGFAADALSIADLTAAISREKAEAWVSESDDEGSFGFGRPSACEVTLTLGATPAETDARRVSISFGDATEGGVFARAQGDPAIFVAPKILRDLASHPAVDRTALRLNPEGLASVTLVHGGTRLLLERRGERLLRWGPDVPDAADPDKLEEALADFFPKAAVHTGPALPDEQMNHPTLQIGMRPAAMGDASRARETRITVGAASRFDGAEVYFARATGVDATFAIPSRAVSAILDAW